MIKKFFIFIFLLLVIILGSEYVLFIVVDYSTANKVSSLKINNLFKHKLDNAIMIFGSSAASRQFDPQVINNITQKTCFNLGVDGVVSIQNFALIKEYLSYEKLNKVIVLVIDRQSFEKRDIIARSDLFLKNIYNNNVYSILYKMDPDKMIKAKFIPGYIFTCLSKAFYKMTLPQVNNMTHDIEIDGFNPVKKPWKNAINIADTSSIPLDTFILNEYQKMIKEINDKGIKVILVRPPYYKPLHYVKNNDLVISAIKKLENQKTYILDYTSDTICNNQTYFHDLFHLNFQGATLFSTKFSNDINNYIK